MGRCTANAYVAATGSGDLPCGAYKVVESQAPEGLPRLGLVEDGKY